MANNMMNFDMVEMCDSIREIERDSKVYLSSSLPIIIRVDGRAFKKFTKGLKQPFDEVFRKSMQETMIVMCEKIPDCRIAYTFSDEISFVIYPKHQDKSGWFCSEIQKITSNTASMATLFFNNYFADNVRKYVEGKEAVGNLSDEENKYVQALLSKKYTAMFDSRAFNIEKDASIEYFLYRQMDCLRNSIPATFRAHFGKSNSINKNKSVSDMKRELKAVGCDWENHSSYNKYGVFCVKRTKELTKVMNGETIHFQRDKWVLYEETPYLVKEKDSIAEYINI